MDVDTEDEQPVREVLKEYVVATALGLLLTYGDPAYAYCDSKSKPTVRKLYTRDSWPAQLSPLRMPFRRSKSLH